MRRGRESRERTAQVQTFAKFVQLDHGVWPFVPGGLVSVPVAGYQGVGITPFIFFLVAGIVEVVAGLVVAFRPDLGGYLVMSWLWGIVINLLLMRNYYDIALRDFGLSLGALSLARLSQGLYGRAFEAATP